MKDTPLEEEDVWLNDLAPDHWRGPTKSNGSEPVRARWVRYNDGCFTAEYHTEEIDFFGHVLNKDTRDDLLWELGVLRVEPYDFSVHKHTFFKAVRNQPRFVLHASGRPIAREDFTVHVHTRGDVMDVHLNTLNQQKDIVFLRGFKHNNHTFDLRFRHISYMSLLGLRASHNNIPEDFEWFDMDGNIVPMNQDTVVDFCGKITDYIRKVELTAHEILNEMAKIEDLVELAHYEVNLYDQLF
jgi:hypothetical protein